MWPQKSNYFSAPSVHFLNKYSLRYPEKPEPLSQSVLDRFETFKKESVEAQAAYAEVSAKVERVAKQLSAAEEELAKNRWSTTKSRAALVQRLTKDLEEAKAMEEEYRLKGEKLLADYKTVIELVSLQESMETSYESWLHKN